MPVNVPVLKKGLTNTEILADIRSGASLEYNRRVPDATQANLSETLRHLQTNRPLWNEFVSTLINRIGMVIMRGKVWDNPLVGFKQGLLTGGDTIEEIMVGLIKARTYDPDREHMEKEIWGVEIPDVQANFHRINRQEYYKVSVNQTLLERAFLNEQGGLSSFVSDLMAAPARSDAWDEFVQTVSLFARYEQNDGFHKVHVPDARNLESDAQDVRLALRKLRAEADSMTFMDTAYNAAHMPTFAEREDLVIFTTPEFNAAVDVEALAGAFNMERSAMHGRVIPIPSKHLDIDGAQAILTTKDFFVMADTYFGAEEIRNPAGLHTNYFLHHHGISSASRFAPAVLFTSKGGSEVINVSYNVTGITDITVEDRNGDTPTTVAPGEYYALYAEGITGSDSEVNTGVAWSLTGNSDDRTYVSPTGVLRIGPQEDAETLTVKATTVWRDPANPLKDGFSKTLALTVAGDPIEPVWPGGDSVTGITVKGNAVDLDGTTGTVKAVQPVTAADVVVEGVAPDNVNIDVDGSTITVNLATGGDDVVYTVTVSDPA